MAGALLLALLALAGAPDGAAPAPADGGVPDAGTAPAPRDADQDVVEHLELLEKLELLEHLGLLDASGEDEPAPKDGGTAR